MLIYLKQVVIGLYKERLIELLEYVYKKRPYEYLLATMGPAERRFYEPRRK